MMKHFTTTRLLAGALLAAALSVPMVGAAQQGPATTTPPAPGELRSWQFPPIREFTMRNGMRVILVERHTLPIVSTRIMFDAGGLREPADKSGLASLTGSLLREGTRNVSSVQLSERMERLGAQFGTVGTFSMSYIDLTALPEVLGEAMELAAATVIEPSFPEAEFRRVQAQAIANYHQTMARVEGIANEAFYRAVFEEGSPFSRNSSGTATSLESITRDDVVQWHRRMFAPNRATVLMVGAISEADARRVLDRAFGRWTARVPDQPEPASPPKARTGTRIILVDRPGSVQSRLMIGQAAPPATSPDYLRLVALTHALGGGFSSRLNMNLRERSGFTYGAFSSLDIRRGGAAFTMGSSVRTDATDSALVEALGEYRRIVNEPLPEAELSGFVNNLVASFPSSAQTVQELRARIQNLVLWGLPLDFYTTYRERLAAVSPTEVQRAAQRHLRPDAPVVVIAGDLSKIEQPIRDRNLGSVEIWDLNGNRLR
jgi:zinc protease